MKLKRLPLCLALAASTALAQQNNPPSNDGNAGGQGPRNVILYIGDGFGLAPKTAARMAMGQGQDGKRFTSDPDFQILALDNLKYNATVTTHSLNSWVTDSGPGASVYACGKSGKQDNEVVSLDPSTGLPIETILENAKKQGYAVGLVTTTRVTHATPAAFASHIWYRDLEDYIAAQYIASSQSEYKAIFNASPNAAYRYDPTRDWRLPEPKVGVELDVLLGGGARHFLPREAESANLVVRDAAGNPVTDPKTGKPVLLSGRRADDVDLVEFAKTQKDYVYVNSRSALMALNLADFGPGSSKKLLGLFNSSHVNYEQDRQMVAPWEPSLADMTRMAIEVLRAKGGQKGFFLMVEGGRIDHLEHANTGGILVKGGAQGNEYTVDVDKPVYEGGGDANYEATPGTARVPNVYGSDYIIKEVLSFDYAVAEGRRIMNVPVYGRTLLLSTSDHECGGLTLVGLHDEADAQENDTKVRTYAGEITKTNLEEVAYATPNNLVRGDGGPGGWFPEYTLKEFQGKYYPEPSSPTARRIVVAYGSNPLTNGNGVATGGTPGNHTPQDIWVGAEDNTGSHAQMIAGRGLLDNTALTPIMGDFLRLNEFVQNLGNPAYRRSAQQTEEAINVYPVPFEKELTVAFQVQTPSRVSVEIVDGAGARIKTLVDDKSYTAGEHDVRLDSRSLRPGLYFAVVTIDGKVVSRKMLKLQ
jgi:alkaline phosphatase